MNADFPPEKCWLVWQRDGRGKLFHFFATEKPRDHPMLIKVQEYWALPSKDQPMRKGWNDKNIHKRRCMNENCAIEPVEHLTYCQRCQDCIGAKDAEPTPYERT